MPSTIRGGVREILYTIIQKYKEKQEERKALLMQKINCLVTVTKFIENLDVHVDKSVLENVKQLKEVEETELACQTQTKYLEEVSSMTDISVSSLKRISNEGKLNNGVFSTPGKKRPHKATYYLQLKRENAHEDSIWCCAWSRISHEKKKPDENAENNENSQDSNHSQEAPEDYIITGGLDDIIKIWQLDNGKLELRHQLEGHSLGLISVAVSPDGKTFASSSQDSSLILWDIVSGERIKTFDTDATDVWTLDFSPDGKHVISGSNAGKILIFSVESGKQEQTLDTRGKFTLSVAYSPDGKYIASGALDGIINIFDVAQGKLVHTLEGHAMPIRSLCFSPDSQLLLTASDDGHMKLYDVVHANLAGTLSGHASWVLSVAFSPDGKRFASSSADRTVRVWDLESMQCQNVFKENSDQVWGVKFNADSNKIVSVSEDKSLIIYSCPL